MPRRIYTTIELTESECRLVVNALEFAIHDSLNSIVGNGDNEDEDKDVKREQKRYASVIDKFRLDRAKAKI